MGSLVVKIDKPTVGRLKNMNHYSDIDMLGMKNVRMDSQVPMIFDVEAVNASIRNILMWRVGENILRPKFGHNIHKSMYEQFTSANKEQICQEIKRAIEDNEPRVTVQSVGVDASKDGEENEQNNVLKVRVIYTVKGDKTNDSKFEVFTELSGK